MKIKVELTIDLKDPAEWTLFTGIEGTQAIREDVKVYVLSMAQNSGVFGNGEVDARITRK